MPRVKRLCLRCKEHFSSESKSNRICPKCKKNRPDLYSSKNVTPLDCVSLNKIADDILDRSIYQTDPAKYDYLNI